MTRTFKMMLLALLLFVAEAEAWDYTTSNPCDTPVEHHGRADGLPPDQTATTPYSATIDLNLPLASKINTGSYNADLTGSEIDVGTALITQEDTYLNVLGNEIPASDSNQTAPGCR